VAINSPSAVRQKRNTRLMALAVITIVFILSAIRFTPPTFSNSLDDPAVKAAFEALNRYRVENGVPPVEFEELKAPLFKVEYLYKIGRLTHYDQAGVHPLHYYTALDGGAHWVEENLALQRLSLIATASAETLIHFMVYSDGGSSWGHRDSLLDPCNNKASIAVARGPGGFYLAVYMMSDWADWIEPPHYANGTFSFKGYIRLPPKGDFYEIYIYRDMPKSEYYGRAYYSIGELYARVLPPGRLKFYRDAVIVADRYIVRHEGNRWYVDVAFRFRSTDSALYTVVMSANSTGVKWSPMSPGGSYRLASCLVFGYTIDASVGSIQPISR